MGASCLPSTSIAASAGALLPEETLTYFTQSSISPQSPAMLRTATSSLARRAATPISRCPASNTSISRAFASTSRALFATHAESGNPILPSLNTFTEEEQLLRETARRFSEEVVEPKVREMDEAEKMDKDIIKGLFDNGFMGIETSADHGGAECSFTSAIIVIEELAKVDPSVSVLCDVHNTLVNTIFRKYGTEEQKAKYLPDLSTCKVGSFCLSEPASGSDAFALKTKATKQENGDYILNGSKMWITNSAEAEIFLVFATVDPSAGYKGITCFIVEKEMGVEIAKKEMKLGIKASSTCTLNFDDIKVPAANVVGEVGKGYKIAIEILNEGRLGIAGQMLGLAEGATTKAIRYAMDRHQFGKPVGSNQVMQHDFARVATELEAARLLLYNGARLKEEGKDFRREAAMAKWYAAQVANEASRKAIEWCGGIGYTRETGIEKYYRDALIGSIYEGTSNIMLEGIAKTLMADMGFARAK